MFLFSMNDLVVVARDQFYITRYFWARGDVARTMFEVLTRRHWGAVQYYDGRRARTLVENLFIPNGINISPDGKYVFVIWNVLLCPPSIKLEQLSSNAASRKCSFTKQWQFITHTTAHIHYWSKYLQISIHK